MSCQLLKLIANQLIRLQIINEDNETKLNSTRIQTKEIAA